MPDIQVRGADGTVAVITEAQLAAFKESKGSMAVATEPARPPEKEATGADGAAPVEKPPTTVTVEKTDLTIQKPVAVGDGDDPLFAQAEAEFAETGSIKPETMAALTKKLPARIVDQYVAGVRAQNELRTVRATQVAGGVDEYKAAVAWAGANLTPAEIQAFNDAITGRSQEQADLAVYGLMGRYHASGAKPAAQAHQRLVGSPSGSGARVVPFRDAQEQTSAMADPRYTYDVEYRNNVLARVAASTHY